jgi:hypothetical protein
MNEPVISLPCFEPAGRSLDISREDLLGHSMAIGSTGSGKTTRFIYPIIEQLIRQSGSKASLCILDSKADGAMREVVTRACQEAGRTDDLSFIDGNSPACLDCFSSLAEQEMETIDAMAGLIGSVLPVDERNRYWDVTFQSLLRQALRLHALNPKIETGYRGLLKHLMRYLMVHQIKDPLYTRLIDHLEGHYASYPETIQPIIDEVFATHKLWDTIDFRTRTNLQSMATSILTPMNSPAVHGMFNGSDPIKVADAMDAGRVLLISIDAVRYPEAARFVGVILKGMFYDAVLSSRSDSMKGLVLDDWPLCITSGFGNRYSDVEALSMIRSAGGFLVAATQSLAALDVTIGPRARAAAVANFANLVFFRSRDQLVDELAAAYLGQKSDKLIDYTRSDRPAETGRVEHPIRIEREIRVPAVPHGSLARLATGDAYALIGSQVYSSSLCLVPTFAKSKTKENEHER